MAVQDLLRQINSSSGGAIEGITVSGGEPLQQLPALLSFLTLLREETNLSVIVFTGYTWSETQNKFLSSKEFLSKVDVLIAGRYDQTQKSGHGLIGSANQTIHLLTERYQLADLQSVPQAEIFIATTGEITMSGVNPVHWT